MPCAALIVRERDERAAFRKAGRLRSFAILKVRRKKQTSAGEPDDRGPLVRRERGELSFHWRFPSFAAIARNGSRHETVDIGVLPAHRKNAAVLEHHECRMPAGSSATCIAPGLSIVSGGPEHGFAIHRIARHIERPVLTAERRSDRLGGIAANGAFEQRQSYRRPGRAAIGTRLETEGDPVYANPSCIKMHRVVLSG